MFANEDTVINVGETALIGLGIALDEEYLLKAHCGDIPSMSTFMSGVYLKLCLRSSLGVKGLILPNGHGVIDMDYRDEIKMIIHNPFGLSREPYLINRGDKIGQLILCRHEGYLLPAEYTLDAERNGGFGSTS